MHFEIYLNLQTFSRSTASEVPEYHNKDEVQQPPCSQKALMALLKAYDPANLNNTLSKTSVAIKPTIETQRTKISFLLRPSV